MRDGDGWRWLEATLLVIERDADGRPARLLATLADVEERHDALERQRLSASLFQHLHEGLLITDAEHARARRQPGLQRDPRRAARRTARHACRSLLRPVTGRPGRAPAARRDVGRAARPRPLARRAASSAARNGETCTLQATISTVRGADGDLRYHVLVISDITEQRAAARAAGAPGALRRADAAAQPRAAVASCSTDAMRAADRDGYLLAVCYLDLDRFKPVNDRFGHAAGDRLLVELAGRLRSALRSRESWADAAGAAGRRRVRAAAARRHRSTRRGWRSSACCAWSRSPTSSTRRRAGAGHRQHGRHRLPARPQRRRHPAAPRRPRDVRRQAVGPQRLPVLRPRAPPPHRRARAGHRPRAGGAGPQRARCCYYQPKVDMRSGRVLGFEALLRWDHPQHGLIAPLQFLPLIENTGLSARVGDWVLVAGAASTWRSGAAAGWTSRSASTSRRATCRSPTSPQRLARAAGAPRPDTLAPVPGAGGRSRPRRIADIEATSALMARCRALGVRFALDDFGTGYSTLHLPEAACRWTC
ncbi:MAG: EAL domain-containing protein [Comamonadaceae bacterium]|nr:EAL domain-containing protein [Comamonadaceae bacterium]